MLGSIEYFDKQTGHGVIQCIEENASESLLFTLFVITKQTDLGIDPESIVKGLIVKFAVDKDIGDNISTVAMVIENTITPITNSEFNKLLESRFEEYNRSKPELEMYEGNPTAQHFINWCKTYHA